MRTKQKRILISVVCGFLAAALMALYASSLQDSARQLRTQSLDAYGGEQVEVYVATRNIAAGERLNSTNISKRVWLTDLLPSGALTSEAEVIGQTLDIPLLANEPVVSAKLSTSARTIEVSEGYCAVSIPTNDVLAVGGAITTGSVITIYTVDKDSVSLLVTDVLILDTSNGNNLDFESNSFFGSTNRPSLTWVTLSIHEDMVGDIIEASRSTSLYLVLPGGEL